MSINLPSYETVTVGAMFYGADYLTGLPDFDHGAPIMLGVDSSDGSDATDEEVCQHPAKSEPDAAVNPDVVSALRHVNKCFLQLGA